MKIYILFSSAHEWVREGGQASDIPLDISVLHNMRQFVKYSRFKQFALRALASTLNAEELSDLRDQFNAIDVDKNGTISLEELKQVHPCWNSSLHYWLVFFY
jgi:calcium-dependent protein kinase